MPAEDTFADYASGLTSPLERGFSATPHDINDLPHVTRELFVGVGGNLVLVLKYGDEITVNNVPDGSRLPYRVKQIKATGTTASNLVGLY